MRRAWAWLDRRPSYVHHPLRTLLRIRSRRLAPARASTGTQVHRLPWGMELELYPRDLLGVVILRHGIFDPCVSETLLRLSERGTLAVDVGANVGYMTSILALGAGPGGEVIAVEPLPGLHRTLKGNATRWARNPALAGVDPVALALSDRQGSATLHVPRLEEFHRGLASLEASSASADTTTVTVPLTTLDDMVGERRVSLVKIDVEGHEPAVLAGAGRLLEAQQIRDIVFESHVGVPPGLAERFAASGYTVRSLHCQISGVRTAPPDVVDSHSWPGQSFLATTDPVRAERILKPRGWRLPGIGWSRSVTRGGRS